MSRLAMDITANDVPAILAALKKDGIWIAPQYAGRISAKQLASIKAAAAHDGVKTYIVVGDVDYRSTDFPGGQDGLLRDLHSELNVDGAYLSTSPGDLDNEVHVLSFPDNDDIDSAGTVAHDTAGHGLTAQLLGTLKWIQKGGASDYLDKSLESSSGGSRSGTSAPANTGSVSHTSTIVVSAVVIAVAVIAALAVLLVRKSRAAARRSGFRPSKAVLANVRAAEDRDWATRAQSAVLALGEAIDATPVPKAPTDAWQAALDHYDAARRVLDRPKHPTADDIGALVLAQRGTAALTAAKAEKGWSPVSTCYFNPLHGVSRREVRWQTVDVPACAACAKAIQAGTEPHDVLDLVHDGVPRPYFQLDVQPWARTGYGALDGDLVGALLTD